MTENELEMKKEEKLRYYNEMSISFKICVLYF